MNNEKLELVCNINGNARDYILGICGVFSMSVDDKITMLFIAHTLTLLGLFIWYKVRKWYKKKQQKAEDYLTAIGAYDE